MSKTEKFSTMIEAGVLVAMVASILVVGLGTVALMGGGVLFWLADPSPYSAFLIGSIVVLPALIVWIWWDTRTPDRGVIRDDG